jgi:hypothetical protein
MHKTPVTVTKGILKKQGKKNKKHLMLTITEWHKNGGT